MHRTRRTLVLAATGIAALGTGGAALATSLDSGLKTSSTSATFSVKAASEQSVRTCTGGDGTYTITRGSWTGTAAGAGGRLDGAIAIRGELGVNKTTGLGWLVGRVKVDAGSDGRRDAGANLRAVIVGGKLTGFVEGRIRDAGFVYGTVAANVTADGLADGQIGAGAPQGAAIVIDRGRCDTVKAQRVVVEARGTVTAVSAASVTIEKSNGDTLTCAVGSDLAATVARLKAGDTAKVTCGLVDGAYRLLRIQSAATAAPKPLKSESGAVTAVSATSLTVRSGDDSLTCVVGSDFAGTAGRLAVGDRVSVTCAYVDGAYRIVRLATSAVGTRPVLRAEGEVTTVSATTIAVRDGDGTTLSCVVGADMAGSVARISAGQKVKVTCGWVDGAYRLLSLRLDD
jgi:hypothetical protein